MNGRFFAVCAEELALCMKPAVSPCGLEDSAQVYRAVGVGGSIACESMMTGELAAKRRVKRCADLRLNVVGLGREKEGTSGHVKEEVPEAPNFVSANFNIPGTLAQRSVCTRRRLLLP